MRIVKCFRRDLSEIESKSAIVYYHADWQDYFVRFWINGKLQKLMTYAALDKDDALTRAEWFVNRD